MRGRLRAELVEGTTGDAVMVCGGEGGDLVTKKNASSPAAFQVKAEKTAC